MVGAGQAVFGLGQERVDSLDGCLDGCVFGPAALDDSGAEFAKACPGAGKIARRRIVNMGKRVPKLKFPFEKCVFLLYFLGFAVESGVLALPTR